MKKLKIWQLVSLLVAVVFGGILFVGLAAGWFSGDAIVIIDKDYICEDECSDFKDVLVSDYEGLINDKKTSFLLISKLNIFNVCKFINRFWMICSLNISF